MTTDFDSSYPHVSLYEVIGLWAPLSALLLHPTRKRPLYVDSLDIKKLLAESEALINKAKTLQRKNREKCVDCKSKQALEDHLRCETCLQVHKQHLIEERKGKQLQRENKPTMYYDSDGKLKYEHRRVMEELLGRALEAHEVVTWRNGIKNDNRPENLILALKAGIPLDDLVCPHCEAAYYQAPTERQEIKDEDGNSFKQSYGRIIIDPDVPPGQVFFLNPDYIEHPEKSIRFSL